MNFETSEHPTSVGQLQETGALKEAPLPPNTCLDRKNHLLASENFGETPRAIIIVTGFPEGPNQLAISQKTQLDILFAQANKEIAVAQVYLGSNPLKSRNPSQYLDHALDEARNSAVKLIVFSAGALSLAQLPEKYYPMIKSLTIISPLAGRESVKSNLGRGAAFLARLPKINNYLDSIAPLVERLLENGVIKVVLGEKDPFIASENVGNSFAKKFPQIPLVFQPRGHPPTPEELLAFINF